MRLELYNCGMMRCCARVLPLLLLLASSSFAASKPHVIAFGPWRVVKPAEPNEASLRIRPLFVDSKQKEYTAGPVHEVTDRLFVVRRVYRMNDSLPEESEKPARWTWQPGGWVSVDRATGHIAQLNLFGWDPAVSEASWYRDYVAYCGTSDDGGKTYMLVTELGRRKPVLRREFTGSSCPAPRWERSPSRVTFAPAQGEKVTFVVQGRSVDLQENSPPEEASQ